MHSAVHPSTATGKATQRGITFPSHFHGQIVAERHFPKELQCRKNLKIHRYPLFVRGNEIAICFVRSVIQKVPMNQRLKLKVLLPVCCATAEESMFSLQGQNGPGQTNTPAGQTPGRRPTPNSQTGQRSERETNRNNSSSQHSALMRAIEMNVAEVQAGKAAESNTQNARVKSFAQMMVKDHNEALTELRAIPGAGNTADVKASATRHPIRTGIRATRTRHLQPARIQTRT